ncbi:reprolysin-like metallopeptidase [Pseudoalteromonas denitrificans]|uniref:Metallo-peptidase family M12B Reprolysin-like n=1 Tax=Pseudoalteromonas denitrificans DSM 6059 TaxID=1123010 RepID=A0A1I1P2J8_9GAMM|nr:zinc-dependent metalloprotease family protein [Pseudoalteromonas denitrificans]SFD00180.1 Metallo-peptidase family M12B Reprolysin-like [Pseudoalteromonas denitrificans DSM 6059]
MKKLYTSIVMLSILGANTTQAQDMHTFKKTNWSAIQNAAVVDVKRINSKALKSSQFRLNFDSLEHLLVNGESFILDLPLPDGKFEKFKLQLSSVMSPELAQKYPNIRTFSGYQVSNPEHHGRFDITPSGFHGVFNYEGDKVFIEPKSRDDQFQYQSYFRKNALPISKSALGKRLAPRKNTLRSARTHSEKVRLKNTQQMKTYKIAIATTGEYSEFHGGTKASTLAALVTLLNRVNEVYQRDLAIKLELVANNDTIIYTDKNSDPFKNTDEDIDAISQVINNAIGNANYDIGHIVGTGGGGLAGFEVVCSETKAEGLTGSDSPTADAFHIDYVAHEIGHQFGADHTFNGAAGSCEGNRESLSAYEPGSATTIMGYAGICEAQNLQNNSDPFFHIHSIDQISSFISKAGSCGTNTPKSNQAPSVSTDASFTIPARTPFTLTGQATDADNDTLSYSWEQYDLGGQTNNKSDDNTDDGKRPLFRTFSPQNTASRTFPKLGDILSNNSEYGETLPTTTREMNFRLVVRDNKGNIADKAVKINVVTNEAGFKVSEPSVSTRWTGTNNLITWNTANTEQAPVSCNKVDILLSTDSGMSFTKNLATSTPNDGSEQVSQKKRE